MAERQPKTKAAGAGQEETPPSSVTPEQFEATPEFGRFKEAMREILAVPKAVLDKRVEESKASSPRKGDPKAPGRKAKQRRRKRREH